MERIQIELHEDQDIEDKLQEMDLSVGTVLRTCVLIDEEVEATWPTMDVMIHSNTVITCHLSPHGKHFSDVNVLGMDFFSKNLLYQ